MAIIHLPHGLSTIVDDEDYEWLSQYKWYKSPSHRYVRRTAPDGRKGTAVYMHREILMPPPGFQVDHIDGNPLNNTRANLRVVTPTQNRANSRPRRVSTSQYKGVSWYARQQSWYAYITIKRHKTTLGRFSDEYEAARVYDAAARLYFGEYARLNFPDASEVDYE